MASDLYAIAHRLPGSGIARACIGVALVVAVGVCAGAAAPSRAHRAGGRWLVVHGYPYAARCPKAGRAGVVDRWGMYACNCTSYVAWALHANHQRTDWFIRGAMDAWNWPNVARRRGIRVVAEPQAGSVAVWSELGRFGHVAYVTRVCGHERFDVAEYNLPGARPHRFRFDMRTNVFAQGVTFIDVPEHR